VDQIEQLEFEEAVRTVARALWPSARFGGVENIDAAEHDGVFPTFDIVHCVEATVSGRLDKAQHDGEKLKKAIDYWMGRDGRLAKGWFITLRDPTPQQSEAIRKIDRRITAVSFQQFKTRLFDIYMYSQLRMNLQFGSAVNPDAEEQEQEPYIPVEFNSLESDENHGAMTFEHALGSIAQGQRLAIVGDYGIGKSMNLREIYIRLTSMAKKDRTLNAPIHINLRDHWGQKSPSAAITQHAEEIGYGNPQQLIAAWRAGFIHVLLDGFDEVAAPGWGGDMASLRSSRRRAVELVRQFIIQTPKRAAVVVAGRRHYFDSLKELRGAMFGYNPHLLLELNEFSSDQISKYLSNRNLKNIPEWLPSRPLLLGHLAARKIFQTDIKAETERMSQAESWDWLLDVISHREAGIVEAGLSGEAVREIVESLASKARNSGSGIGPLSQREITEAFIELRGQEPSDSEQAILQRLPGLARDPDFEEGSRSFVDIDFASVAQARDVSNLAFNPFGNIEQRAARWRSSLNALGIEVASHQFSVLSPVKGGMISSFKYGLRKDLYVALADLVRMSIVLGESMSEPVLVNDVQIPSFSLSEAIPDLSSVVFTNCLFDEIEFAESVNEAFLPHFESCFIESVIGRFGVSDLPAGIFANDCIFEQFPDAADSNAAVMNSGLPVGVRVVLIILRKLYRQSGRGRLEGALSRGMPQEERNRVPACLSLLQKEQLVSSTRVQSRKIWLPNRSSQIRALKFIEAPRGSGDSLYSEASKL
jgi:hypothetical protein